MRLTDGFSEKWNGFECSIPRFSSDSKNINIIAWVDAIDKYISVRSKYFNISTYEVAYKIGSKLQGNSYYLYKNYIEKCKRLNKNPTWEEIRNLSMQKFSTSCPNYNGTNKNYMNNKRNFQNNNNNYIGLQKSCINAIKETQQGCKNDEYSNKKNFKTEEGRN